MRLHGQAVPVLGVFLLLALSPDQLSAQGCCTPGSSPMGGVAGGPLLQGSWEFGVSLTGFQLDQGYEGSTKVDDPRYSEVASAAFFVRFGASHRLALIAELPVDYRMREIDLGSPFGGSGTTSRFSNTSVGDFTTLVMFRAWPGNSLRPLAVNVGIGLKWPTGPDRVTQDGLILPIELQTGTGTIDLLVALSAFRSFTWGALELVGATRFPTRADSGYLYGVETNLVFLGHYAVGRFRLGGQLEGRFAGANDFRGRTVTNTGGHRLMAGPYIGLQPPVLPVSLEGSFVLPVWQNLEGEQLGVTKQVRITMRLSPQ